MDDFSSIRPTCPENPFLLAADIDGTLLGDEMGEAWLKAFAGKYASVFRLAYVTGRYRFSVLELIDTGRLPRPDFICSDVGTDLFDLNDPQNGLGQKYWSQVASDWDLEAIYKRGVGKGVWLQDFGDKQPPYQAGFFWDGNPENLEAFRARMANDGRYHIYPSYGEYIDVLPALLGKGNAVRFLQKELGIDENRVIIAGDSGNDLQMFETEFKGIVPSNALEELKKVASQPWHFHSPLPAARGVLDGLRYFGLVESVDRETTKKAGK
jgi:hydroxymethylpyrimidine pyrophosphatase-like HAD family hydrolase